MCEPEITMSYIPMEGCSRAINQREGSLGHVVPGDGGRLGPLGGGRPPAPPTQHPAGGRLEEEGAEGWRRHQRERGS